LPKPGSVTEEIRSLLRQGYAYSEIHEMTGYAKHRICNQGFVLESLGEKINKRTDDERKRYFMNVMRMGFISDVMEALSADEVERLMAHSFESWSDAITKVLKEGLK
jgi:hypothetical protein